jgi:hypothetical protein
MTFHTTFSSEVTKTEIMRHGSISLVGQLAFSGLEGTGWFAVFLSYPNSCFATQNAFIASVSI